LPPSGSVKDDDLIKRVVAIAGDTVEIRAGALVLNGVPVPRERGGPKCSYWDRREGGPWSEQDCDPFVEQLDGHRYETYCTPHQNCGDVPAVTVPAGFVWLAGDHRDHSADSRVFGPVPVGRIKGRAWVALGSWGPDGPRWNRMLHAVDH
jgi:signal peptidase I